MKGLARFLIRLYPANWRARYGEEFEALLEDSSAGWPATFDLLKGAIQMQFSVPAFPKLALMLSITGLLGGLVVSSVMTPTYISQAMVRLGTGLDSMPPRDLVEQMTRLEQQVFSRSSLSAIIQDPMLNLYPEERARMPLEDVIERMRKQDVRIIVVGKSAFSVSFAYRDRVKARDTVQALLTRFNEANLSDQRAQSAAGVNLEVIDPPSLPVRPASPNRWLIMAAGFGAGFVAALVIAVFRRSPPPMPLPAQTA